MRTAERRPDRPHAWLTKAFLAERRVLLFARPAEKLQAFLQKFKVAEAGSTDLDMDGDEMELDEGGAERYKYLEQLVS